jgi:GNAT superfamily N-acetyltransferase
VIVDAALVQRVERSGARHTAMEVDSLATVVPSSGAHRRTIGSGIAAAMGPGRYVNRAVGAVFGHDEPTAFLDQLEAFYRNAGLPPSLEVCPWAPTELVSELRARGYVVEWFRNVYARGLRTLPSRPRFDIKEVGEELEFAWAAILGSAFDEGTPQRTNSDEFCAAVHRVPGAQDLVAMLDGRPVGTGSLTAIGTIAWLGGASTLPEARGRGAQHALLIDRLHRAHRMGCTLAAVTAVPDGVSARNLLRVGFQLLYTQAVMTRH